MSVSKFFLFIPLICVHTLSAQNDSIVDQMIIDSLMVNTKPAKKILEVPPFVKFDPDTIQLDENDLIISDSYTALGKPYVYDALHSFNRRRMDGFGGFLNEKINAGLAQVRQNGFPSDLKKLYIQIDPHTLTVYWAAVVGPSEDGKCYLQVDSRGSAGGGLQAVLKQCPRMHNLHTSLVPVKQLEFNDNVYQCYDWHGEKLDTVTNMINIQQHFYKYYDPQIGTTIALEDYVKKEAEMPVMMVAKPVSTSANYKRYTVKSGDTVSQIAQRYKTTPSKIKQINNLKSYTIRVGQVLKIPN